MKIKTEKQTYLNIPNKCDHVWRLFGTRMDEEVYCPGVPKNSGFVICDKCGWNPFVDEFKIIGKRKGVKWINGFDDNYDTMIEIVRWGCEEPPNEPAIIEWAWLVCSWWDRLKDKLKFY